MLAVPPTKPNRLHVVLEDLLGCGGTYPKLGSDLFKSVSMLFMRLADIFRELL
jgi:hypothetical protein